MRIAVMMCVALSFAGHAWAQPATPDTDLTKLGYVSAGDIAAGLKKLPQDRADISMRIFQIPPYNINAAHRAPGSQFKNMQQDQSELFMVIEGTGSIVWGGTITSTPRNGATLTGRGIDGGTTQKLAKGDFFVVPPGLPHMFANIAPGGLQLMQIYLPK